MGAAWRGAPRSTSPRTPTCAGTGRATWTRAGASVRRVGRRLPAGIQDRAAPATRTPTCRDVGPSHCGPALAVAPAARGRRRPDDDVDPSPKPVREQLVAAAGVDADEYLGRPSRDTEPLSVTAGSGTLADSGALILCH